MRSAAAILLALVATTASTACRHHDRDDEDPDYQVSHSATYTSDTTLRSGDVRIVDEHEGVELALIGDSISGGLSQRTLEKVRHDTDTLKVHGTGFGASIEKLVKGTVASALASRITIPVADVTDISYEDGRIRIQTKGSKGRLFEHTKVNNRNAMDSFRPEDARRFVAAVKARQEQMGIR